MKFTVDEVWAVKQALREMYADGVPGEMYNEACTSIRESYECGIFTGMFVDEDTLGGQRLAEMACVELEKERARNCPIHVK